MTNNTQKSYANADGETTVLKFRGHPRYDAFRVENDSTGPVDVNVYVNTDDELDNVTPSNSTLVDSTTGLGADSNFGTEASARSVLIELVDDTSDTAGSAGTVYGHNANDPAMNGTAFANR